LEIISEFSYILCTFTTLCEYADRDNNVEIGDDPTIQRDNYERNFIPENPGNNQVGNISGRQTRYKDQDYERWTQKTAKVKRSETMREKVNKRNQLLIDQQLALHIAYRENYDNHSHKQIMRKTNLG